MKGSGNRGTKIDVPGILYAILATAAVGAFFWWLTSKLNFFGAIILLAVLMFAFVVRCIVGLLSLFSGQ